VYRGCDKIYVLPEVCWEAVFIASNMRRPSLVFKDVELGLEQRFGFLDSGVEVKPVETFRQANAGGINARIDKPGLDRLYSFVTTLLSVK